MIPILFLWLPISLLAQLTDDFSDGNFTANPSWLGQTTLFQVTNGELQLSDPAPASSNSSYLAVSAPTASGATTVWEFLVRLDFSPSASNLARVYLNASHSDLRAALNGYYIKIGGISGSDDALELFRQDGSSSTLLVGGTAGALGGAQALARVQVMRTASGTWTMNADYTGGTNFQMEGTATDATYPNGAYFGFLCNYSSTRSSHFFFDDVLIDPIFQDNDPPQLLSGSALSATMVNLLFDEPIQVPAANQLSISPAIGSPSNVAIGDTPNSLVLTLATPLSNQQVYTLNAEGIQDSNGNTAGTQTTSFTFFNVQEAELNDIIISEIMADPSPAVGLPAFEYVELYNRSDKVIQLSDLTISTGSSPKPLPSVNLQPGNYIIVCTIDAVTAFESFGMVAGVASFPSLTNGGDDIFISTASGNTIFQVTYTAAWYQDILKAEGGWSLELIQTEGPYNCTGNWRASEHPTGGTPGQVNSLQGIAPDTQGPSLIRAFAVSDMEVILVFDEAIDPILANASSNYSIEPALPIGFASLQSPENQEVVLVLGSPVAEGVVYTVTVNNEISDCLGNRLSENNSLQFGLTVTPEPGDIVINEVLFNPSTGGSDFVELYNRSDKIFNLRNLRLNNFKQSGGSATAPIEQDFLLFPSNYAVLSAEPADIMAKYQVPFPLAMIKNALPSLPDDEGNISLTTPSNMVIDSFDYNKDLHSPLLDDENGVSLERSNPERPTQDASNWHSAAAAVGFATPTYKNSQFIDTVAVPANEIIFLPNPRFSPDADGFEDVLLIEYQTEKPGFSLNLHVFDAQGRLVHRLVRNEVLATKGSFTWDGSINMGEKARTGIYVLWAEIHHPDGQVEQQKSVFVLAGMLGN